MKITAVDTILLTGPCTLDPYICACRNRRSVAFIRIETDVGISGWGETYGGYFLPEPIPEIVSFFEPVLLGRDPEKSEELWQRMYQCGNFWCRVGLGAIVLAGIDAALWDIRGKAAQLPVWKLLLREFGPAFKDAGDFTGYEQLPVYASGGPSNYPLPELAGKIDHALQCGFRAVKLGAGSHTADHGFECEMEPERAAAFEHRKTEFIRTRFGRELGLMYDGHMGNSPSGTWDFETARAVVQALDGFNIRFYEEPLHYTRPDWYAELRRQSPIPIAGGECLSSECEWDEFIRQDCFDVGQPDASYTSGLGAVMRVAAKLSHRGARIATHSWGAGGSLMQNIHAAFAMRNIDIVEASAAYGPLHTEVMRDFRMRDGFLLAPELPGLGIEVTPELIAAYPFVRGSGEFNSVPGKVMMEEQR